MFCINCGKEIFDDAVMCVNCGNEVKPAIDDNSIVNPTDKNMAVLLIIFVLDAILYGIFCLIWLFADFETTLKNISNFMMPISFFVNIVVLYMIKTMLTTFTKNEKNKQNQRGEDATRLAEKSAVETIFEQIITKVPVFLIVGFVLFIFIVTLLVLISLWLQLKHH